MLAGMMVTGAGLRILSQVSAETSFAGALLPAFVLSAAGMGATAVPLPIAAFAGVADSDYGVASGLLNISQQLGGAVRRRHLVDRRLLHLRAHPAARARGLRGLPARSARPCCSLALGSSWRSEPSATPRSLSGSALRRTGRAPHAISASGACRSPTSTRPPAVVTVAEAVPVGDAGAARAETK
jgi:hypothetical protein